MSSLYRKIVISEFVITIKCCKDLRKFVISMFVLNEFHCNSIGNYPILWKNNFSAKQDTFFFQNAQVNVKYNNKFWVCLMTDRCNTLHLPCSWIHEEIVQRSRWNNNQHGIFCRFGWLSFILWQKENSVRTSFVWKLFSSSDNFPL